MNINFPGYFHSNNQFDILQVEDYTMVKYFHSSNLVKDIKLSINQVFFVVVISGEVRLNTQKSYIRVERGMSALINEGTYIMSEGLGEDNNEFKAYLFFLPKPVIKEYFSNSKIHVPNHKSEVVSNVLTFNHTQFLKDYIENSAYLFNNDIESNVLLNVLKLKVKELLHFFELNEESERIYQLLLNSVDEDRYKIETIVKNNFLSGMSIEEMAFLCNTSTSTFKRQFKEIFGTSPGKWITTERMTQAKRIIQQGNLNMTEVALSCGYSNLSSFGRSFKKEFGLSPSEFSGQFVSQ